MIRIANHALPADPARHGERERIDRASLPQAFGDRSEQFANRLEVEARIGKARTLANQLSRLDLVVLDELGILPFACSGGELLFHLVSKLYERI